MCDRQEIIDGINNIFWDNYECYGRRIDLAIEYIRSIGIRNEDETTVLLKKSCYGWDESWILTLISKVHPCPTKQ